jgi:hypothetical protein
VYSDSSICLASCSEGLQTGQQTIPSSSDRQRENPLLRNQVQTIRRMAFPGTQVLVMSCYEEPVSVGSLATPCAACQEMDTTEAQGERWMT